MGARVGKRRLHASAVSNFPIQQTPASAATRHWLAVSSKTATSPTDAAQAVIYRVATFCTVTSSASRSFPHRSLL